MGSLGKQKGAAFERSVCQRLSLWVTDMRREDVYWRSAMSGGRATLKSRKGTGIKYDSQQGDICAVHKAGHALLGAFVAECKFYADLGIEAAAFGDMGKIGMFWEELEDQCSKCHSLRLPFLVAKQNRKPELLLTNKLGWQLLTAGAKKRPKLLITFPRFGARACLFRDLITMVNFRNEVLPNLREHAHARD
jgi:hypothetical protein